MANVILNSLDYNAVLRVLTEEMSLDNGRMLIVSFDPGSGSCDAKVCESGAHLHLLIGMGMPINAALIYCLSAFMMCYASEGYKNQQLPPLREAMLAYELFLQRSSKKMGTVIDYLRECYRDSTAFTHAYRDLLSLIQSDQYPQPVFTMPVAPFSGKKEDLN